MNTTANDTTGASVWEFHESPLGRLTLLTGPRGLTGLRFPGRTGPLDERRRGPDALAAALAQLDEYFAGERVRFDLPLDLHGSPFERAVWERLLQVPSGETIGYEALARDAGRPDRPRPVRPGGGRPAV